MLPCLLLLSLLQSVHCLTPLDNATFEWSTYKPQLYFGFKPSLPRSLSFGITWHGVQSFAALSNVRHTCEQDDGVESYNWLRHDGRNAGQQIVKDTANNVLLTTSFLKVQGGSKFGGHWGVRISGKPINPSLPSRISITNYVSIDGLGSLELDEDRADEDGLPSYVELTGETPDLGKFHIKIVESADLTNLQDLHHQEDFGDKMSKFQYVGVATPIGQVWRVKEFLNQEFSRAANLIFNKYGKEDPPDPALLLLYDNNVRTNSNLMAVQRVVTGTWSIDVLYEDKSLSSPLDSLSMTNGLEAFATSYDSHFDQTFHLQSKGYNQHEINFARTTTANMFGGIGYFYGNSLVDAHFSYAWDDEEGTSEVPKQHQPVYTEERELLTATPCRPFFPRGFYWDEGFHLLLIGIADPDLSLRILHSWMGLIDENGWVGREQILGDESRSKVPQEFITQYPSYGNPPTLPLAIVALLRHLEEYSADDLLNERSVVFDSLRDMYPALKRHYEWFIRTQRGSNSHGRLTTYRWRGRSESHVLTSGLDDYPRAKPASREELHIDLSCWMAFFSRTMQTVAARLGQDEDSAEFQEHYERTWSGVEALHWSEEHKAYCDVSVDENEDPIHVCHKGYVTLLPLMLSLIPAASDRLGHMLHDLSSPEVCWSKWGILSLSRQDPDFGTQEDYWRGSVWIQMNYLVLQALHQTYAKASGPHQIEAAGIYSELRQNVVTNLVSEFDRTGFVWEQYNANSGKGQRSRAFTGWTALVVNIMAEMY